MATREEQGGSGATELRVALAMRGGVSLAVWIGGAVAEFDLVRRAMLPGVGNAASAGSEPGESARAEAYAAGLRALGYSSIKFDVLAGASAGGLNAVIYGYAQSLGIDLHWLLGVWRKHGDIWKLFHTQWSPRRPFRTEALLDADRHFYLPLREELLSAGRRPRGKPTDYLTVDLSATLQAGSPLEEIFPPNGAGSPDLRPRSAHFRFRRTPGHAGSFTDFPVSTAEGQAVEADDQRVRRLAYAARATSSFPGAFEPAAIHSWRPVGTSRPGSDTPADGDRPLNMADVFSEVGEFGEPPFDVMDGGVFDNIPIARAVQAIEAAPAAVATKRILIYLDPSPDSIVRPPVVTPEFAGDPPVRRMRARFLRSVFKALSYKVTTESSSDDLKEIEGLRAALTARKLRIGRQLSVVSASLGIPSDTEAPGAELAVAPTPVVEPPTTDGYVRFRVFDDAQRFVELAMYPGVGFLRRLVPPPVVTRALSPDRAGDFRRTLVSRLAARAEDGYDPMTDAGALCEAADLFIAWVRRQQDRPQADKTALAAAKGKLYLVRAWANYHRERRERAAFETLAGPDPIDLDLIAGALWPELPEAGPDADFNLDEDFWESVNDWEAVGAGGVDPVAAGWAALLAAVLSARSACLPPSEPVVADLSLPPSEPVVADPSLALLQGLVAQASVAVGRLGTTAVPDFYQVTADEELPDGATTETLAVVRKYAAARRLDEEARTGATPGGPTLPAASKVTGSQLFNFGGFLATPWREHDYAWGRADAAAGMLRVLGRLNPTQLGEASADPASQGLDAPGPDPLAGIRGAILDPDSGVYAGLDHRPDRLSDLSSSRRYAIVARIGLGLQRALWALTPLEVRAVGDRRRGWVSTVIGAAIRMSVRPLLVFLPLAARPLILAAVVACAWVAEHLLPAEGPWLGAKEIVVGAAVVAAVLVGAKVVVLRRQQQMWSDPGLPDPQGLLDAIKKKAARWYIASVIAFAFVGALAVVLVLTLPGVGAAKALTPIVEGIAMRVAPFDIGVALIAVAVLVVAAGRVRAVSEVPRGAQSEAAGGGWLAHLASWLAMLVVPVLVVLAWHFARLGPPVSVGSPGVAIAAAVVVLAIHHAWSDPRWLAGVTAGTFIAAFFILQIPPQVGGWLAWLSLYCDVFLVSAVAIPVVVLAVAFGAILLARKVAWAGAADLDIDEQPNRVDLAVSAVFSAVVGTAVMWIAREMSYVWAWLDAIPLGLTMGCAAAAITTLVVPFRAAEELRPV